MLAQRAQATGGPPGWALAGIGLALLAGGVLAGRATADSDPAPAAQPPPATDQADEAPGPGPTGVEAGMPTGFAPDEAGAVAAATAYTVALGGPLLFEDRLDEALEVAATEDSRDEIEQQFAEGAELLTERLNLDDREVLAPTAPAGYRLEDFAEGQRATVAVWAAGFMIAGEAPVPAGWTTTTVELEWTGDDWKLAGLSSTDGPAPPDEADAGAVANTVSEMKRFEPYRHVPAEVE